MNEIKEMSIPDKLKYVIETIGRIQRNVERSSMGESRKQITRELCGDASSILRYIVSYQLGKSNA